MWRAFFLYGLLPLWAWNYQQLLEPFPGTLFMLGNTPITYSSSSERLYTALYSDSYALTAWINTHALPAASQEFLYIATLQNRSSLQAKLNTDGSITLNISVCGVTYTFQIIGITIHVWMHVGIGLNYNSQQAWVSLVSWAGVQMAQTQALSFTSGASTTVLSTIVIGGSSPVANKLEMADSRYYSSALAVADMVTVAGAGTCEVEDLGVVPRPSIESCLYYQMIGRTQIVMLSNSNGSYTFPYPRLDSSYSATQWMWFDSSDGATYRSVLRLTQTGSNMGHYGDRIMIIVHHLTSTPNKLEASCDTATINNYGAFVNLPVKTI